MSHGCLGWSERGEGNQMLEGPEWEACLLCLRQRGGQWCCSGGSRGDCSEGTGEFMVGTRRADRSLGPRGPSEDLAVSSGKPQSSEQERQGLTDFMIYSPFSLDNAATV